MKIQQISPSPSSRFKAVFAKASNSQLTGFALIWIALIIWNFFACEEISITSYFWLLSLLVVGLFSGDILLKLGALNCNALNTLPGKLLIGLITSNFALIIFSQIFPVELDKSWIILAVLICTGWLYLHKNPSKLQLSKRASGGFADNLFIGLALIATTAWSFDLLSPIESGSDVYILKAWRDVYVHLSQITAIALAHGPGTISDIQMSGAPAHPYHIASYFFPAALVSTANISSLEAYASLQVPLGMLLLAFGGYSLGQSLFGNWPGFAAGLGAILLPDALQQGFQNLLLSYYWILEISPAMAYGIASASLVFLFLLQIYRTPKIRLLGFSYFFLFMTLIYKAQIFVAIAYLALILPVFAFQKIRLSYKIILATTLTALFFLVIYLSQMLPSIPVMRFDGSGLDPYYKTLLGTQLPGIFRKFCEFFYAASTNHWPIKAILFNLFLILTTFGVYSIIYIKLFSHIKKSFSKIIWIFPVLTLAIYLAMSTFMAMDDRRIGSPEEFLHRPFVWAFFILAIWCSAGAYHRFFGNLPPSQINKKYQIALVILLALFMFNAFHHGSSSQRIPAAKIGYQEVPACLAKVAAYIKIKSGHSDLVQSSQEDRQFMLTALSERQPYAVNGGGIRAPRGLQDRLENLEDMKKQQSKKQIEDFMAVHKISWYVIEPNDSMRWESNLSDRLIFTCAGYRVFKFY